MIALNKLNKICLSISVVSLILTIALGVVVYQQQNYIQQLSNSTNKQSSQKSAKKLTTRIENVESTASDNEDAIADLNSRVSALEDSLGSNAINSNDVSSDSQYDDSRIQDLESKLHDAENNIDALQLKTRAY